MSLPDEATHNNNPFAPPSVLSSIETERQQWGWPRVIVLLFVGCVFQVVITALTIHFLRSGILGVVHTPFIHLL